LLLYSSKPSLGVFQLAGHLLHIFHVNLAPEVFCHRCHVLKKKLSHHHHRAINKFSGAIAGEEEDFCKGSFVRTSFTLF
jgi:hypothetical protein